MIVALPSLEKTLSKNISGIARIPASGTLALVHACAHLLAYHTGKTVCVLAHKLINKIDPVAMMTCVLAWSIEHEVQIQARSLREKTSTTIIPGPIQSNGS